jgi:hypothetical protein
MWGKNIPKYFQDSSYSLEIQNFFQKSIFENFNIFPR